MFQFYDIFMLTVQMIESYCFCPVHCQLLMMPFKWKWPCDLDFYFNAKNCFKFLYFVAFGGILFHKHILFYVIVSVGVFVTWESYPKNLIDEFLGILQK